MRSNNLVAVKRRMLIGAVVPLLVLLAIAAVYLVMLSKVNAGVDRIYMDRVVPLQQLKRIADEYAVKVIDAANKANAGLYRPTQALADVDGAQTTIQAEWQAYLKTELTPQEQALATQAKALFANADNAIKRFRTHLGGIGNSAQGLLDDFDGPLYADIDPISNKITELVDLQLRVAEHERNAAWAIYRQVMVTTAVLVPVGIAVLIYSAFLGFRSLSAPLAVVDAMDKVTANMDLKVRAPERHGQLAASFNRLVTSFQELVQTVNSGTRQVLASSDEVTAIMGATADGTQRQRRESEQVATAANEMTMSIKEIAQTTATAAEATNNAKRLSDTGYETVANVVTSIKSLAEEIDDADKAIDKLNHQSTSIGTVLDVIRGIAEQTNLLALNAAIEAARAGEQGRGFAVVADEVRTLAQRTQDSTQEIEDMVEGLRASANLADRAMSKSQTKVSASVEIAEQAGKALADIRSNAERISDMTTQLASAAEEQSTVVEDINRSIIAINDVSGENATGAEQAIIASQELAQMTGRFQKEASVFKA